MKKPNILIIYTDQLSRNLLSCYGGTEIETPHIDSIAKTGVQLTNFYTVSAVCTPSRACFMTGKYPYENGAYRNGLYLNENQHGFAEGFHAAGYRTGYLGKWHLHKEYGEGASLCDCNRLGFEDWDYPVEFGHCKSVLEQPNRDITLSQKVGDCATYTTDWLADKTVAFVKRQTDNTPFLFMVSIPDPHQPYKVRSPYNTMFNPEDVLVPDSFFQKDLPDWVEHDEWGRNHYFPWGILEREDHFRRLKAQYLGQIKCLDDAVGRIIAALREKNLYDNTLLLFTTDHGEYMGEHGLLEKNNLYDSVYQLPFLLSCPSLLPQGKQIDDFFSIIDFGDSLAGLAGISLPHVTSGKDRSSLLQGCDSSDGMVAELYQHPSDVPRAGIITPEYHLAYVGKGWNTETVFQDHILFDRINDPHSLHNLYLNPAYREIVSTLREKIMAHHKERQTPLAALPREVWYS